MTEQLFGLTKFFSSNNKKENKKILELIMLEHILCIHATKRFLSLVREIKKTF
jgi:hypothetical protein